METGPSRKRLRRDQKSCLECRRRKVKCQLTSEDVSACEACVKNGVPCSSQVGETPSMTNGVASASAPASRTQEDRLQRIEHMLNRMIEFQGAEPMAHVPFNMESGPPEYQPLPTWLMFDNNAKEASYIPDNLLTPTLETANSAMSNSAGKSDLDSTNAFLLGLFPAQQDVEIITEETMAWIFGLPNPPGNMLQSSDGTPSLNLEAVAQCNTAAVAKALLYLALYVQQLPPDFDVSRLQTPGVVDTVYAYAHHVNASVLSDEDMACTDDGIQCLLILGMIYINEGDIRKAWINFRRAVDIAKVKGYHTSYSTATRECGSVDAFTRRRLWLSSVMGDSYTSLLLGLESGAGRKPFGSDLDWVDPMVDADANFERGLSILSAQLSYRDISGEDGRDGAFTRDMDDRLKWLEESVPDTWWRTPRPNSDKSLESARAYNRLVCQQWFLQLRILTHLRDLLDDRTNDDGGYGASNCLDAARITIHGYMGLRQSGVRLMHCRGVDIAVFVASVVVILAMAMSSGDTAVRSRLTSDMVLVEQVIALLSRLGQRSNREHIPRESALVLRILMEACEGGKGALQKSNPSSTPMILPDEQTVSSRRHGQSRLHDVLSNCFQNILGKDHPASRLVDATFSARNKQSDQTSVHQGLFEDPGDDSTRLGALLEAEIIDWGA